MKIYGRIVDVLKRVIFKGCVTVYQNRIVRVDKCETNEDNFIMPGLIDSHIHIESAMITPGAFAVEAVKHGTIAVVSDPHEIANVCGMDGFDFMIDDAKKVPLKFYFGAPSCVPATTFETCGGVLNSLKVKNILNRSEIHYLSEMMNFPGVISENKEVFAKINAAKMVGKPIDGHAPGLSGEDLRKYVGAGISTDHECSTIVEALEKISLGMKILIREGSAAKNLENLKQLFINESDNVMLCSDDLHPEMLVKGHINILVARLVKDGFNVFDVLRSVSVNPIKHYNISAGLLQKDDSADFIVVESLESMNVIETWINGDKVYDKGTLSFKPDRSRKINNFNCSHISSESILIFNRGENYRIIEAIEGELITKEIIEATGTNKIIESDTIRDYLKIVVKDRYQDASPAVGFIKGFNLKAGAFASSVAHDSHNIICVGTNDNDIVSVINAIIDMEGGLAVIVENRIYTLQLNIGGIMTSNSCRNTAITYDLLTQMVIGLGCRMESPFMTLAFMALLVIPELKIGDKGLFNVKEFNPVSLFC